MTSDSLGRGPSSVIETAHGTNSGPREDTAFSGAFAPATPVRLVLSGVHSARAVKSLLIDSFWDANGDFVLPFTIEVARSKLADLDAKLSAIDRAWRMDS